MNVPNRRPSRQRIATTLAALGAVMLFSACGSPVRLASPGNTPPRAAAASASPKAGSGPTIASPNPGAAAGSGALAQFQAGIRAVIDKVMPSVVQVDTTQGLGSGIILDNQGDIVTNAHVVGAERSFTVTLFDGHTARASLVGTYPGNDLAVVRVSSDNNLKPAVFADSSQVHVGDIVLAVGSPLGLTDSVSEGIVSALGRSQPEGNGVTLNNLIQMTAAINPGNSGGALVDINGQVVGIPTLAGGSGRGGAATNIGFAISSNQVVTVTRQLATGTAVTHTNQPYMGISVSDGPNGEALIASVVSGGPADKAGLKAGWIVTSIGSHAVSNPAALTQLLAGYKVGDKINVTLLLPDGSNKTLTVTLGERPVNP